MLGHPEILKRFNHPIKIEDLQKQVLVEKVTQAVNSTESFTYDFVELAPDVFSIIRKINSLHEKTLKLIFSQENLEKLHVRVSSAKGG